MNDDENLIAFPSTAPPTDADTEATEEMNPRVVPRELLIPAIEACLFAVTHPIPTPTLASVLGVEEEDVLAGLEALRERQLRSAAGVRVVEVAEGWQLRTEPRLATWVAAIRGGKPFRLSRPTLETLAVVAFRQPVTKGDVDEVRGVDSGGILRTLLERGLVKLSGRSEEPGRPLLYGTSPQFLTLFGMRSLADLPTLRDLRVLGDEAPSAPLSAVVPFAAEELRGGLPPAV